MAHPETDEFFKNPTIEGLFKARDEGSYLLRLGALQANGVDADAIKILAKLRGALFQGESDHVLTLSEGERQAVLMALAHLAIERPGWDDMLSRIARRIDNPGPEMYNGFKKLRTANKDIDKQDAIEALIEKIQKPS